MTLLVLAMGCRSGAEIDHQRRIWEMDDHAADLLAARDALLAGDLAAVEDAGLRLAAPDPLPGLPDEAIVTLEAVRAGGRLLATSDDPAEAADLLVAVTLSCAACHRRMGISAPAGAAPQDLLWYAVAFESEAAWAAAAGSGPASWRERRAGLADRLARGQAGW
jgi:hypothetical protein